MWVHVMKGGLQLCSEGEGKKWGGGATAEKAGVARINDRRRDAAAKEAPVVRYS